MTKQNIKGDFCMCFVNCNIIEVENKEIKRNSDITYEERCKIEFMIKKKYTMQEMAEELGRNKSIISREINRHCDIKWNYDKIETSCLEKNKRRTEVYYTDPYSSWQKGMNENCNGILRRFIPKGTDLNSIPKEKLEEILRKINGKPRKILGFISADKRFEEELNKIVA